VKKGTTVTQPTHQADHNHVGLSLFDASGERRQADSVSVKIETSAQHLEIELLGRVREIQIRFTNKETHSS